MVDASMLEQIERGLADESAEARSELDGAFARFESTQPELSDAISQVLSRPLDETALALGYFLSIAVWLAFERTFGAPRLREVSADALRATEEAINLEEELRAAHGDEPVDAALEPRAPASETVVAADSSEGEETAELREVDADDVHAVYRAIVLLTLCLSHAVLPVDGAARGTRELMA